MTGGKVRQYPYFVGLFHTSTPLGSVELSKEWQRVYDWGKVRQYPYFVGLFHTSTPLRSLELSKKWRNSGFHGQRWTWLSKLQLVFVQMNSALIKFLEKRKKIPVMVFNCRMRRFTVPKTTKSFAMTSRPLDPSFILLRNTSGAGLIPNGILF